MKWFGRVGYSTQQEVKPGVWKDVISERQYYGNADTVRRRTQSSDKLNDDFVFSTEISIIADPFAYSNFKNIRYVEFMGVLWEVSDLSINRPRMILSLGGEYHDSKQ